MLMKITRFLLLFVFGLCTFNTWAQSNEAESLNIVSENTAPVNLDICVSGVVDGILYLYVDNQPLYRGYWGDGYMLIRGGHVDFKPQINVFPGDVIKLYAYLHGIGNSGTMYLEIPDNASSTLYVMINTASNFKIGAYFN